MIRRLAAVLLLACAACTADRARQQAPAAPLAAPDSLASDSLVPDGVAEPPLPEPVPEADAAYLVWSADTAWKTETAWIDGAGRVLARRPGVVVAGGGGVWAWTEGEKRMVATSCECYRKNEYDPEAYCPEPATVAVVDLVDLLGGRRVPVLRVDSGISVAPPRQGAVPYTGVGPYLFVENATEWYDCYHHEGFAVDPFVLDLSRGGAAVALVDSAGAAAVVARQGAEAREAMLREFEESSLDTAEVPSGPPGFSSVEAAWTAEGRLRVSYRFLIGACFTCSNEHASSYSMSAAIPAAGVPPRLAPYAVAPDAVRLYWRRSPPGEHAGWSRVDAADRAAVLARFRRR
jgi:hypothetical protein